MVLEVVRNEQYYGVDGPPRCPLYQWKIVRKDSASRVQREWAAWWYLPKTWQWEWSTSSYDGWGRSRSWWEIGWGNAEGYMWNRRWRNEPCNMHHSKWCSVNALCCKALRGIQFPHGEPGHGCIYIQSWTMANSCLLDQSQGKLCLSIICAPWPAGHHLIRAIPL